MLRDLLVRVSAGLLSAAIAVSCTRDGDAPREDVGSVQQAAALAGQGGAELGAGGAPADPGGAPAMGQGGAGGEPETCDPATCEGPNSCTRCVGNQCVRYTAADNHTCRAADASGCDVADVCDGTSDSCADAVAPSTTKCRDAAGLCDADDFCNGTTKVCADGKRANGFVCRDAVATGCDIADTCNGTSNACPDVVRPSTTKCRDAAAGGCDVDDFCDGATSACADAKRPVNFVCRPTVAGGCDVEDVCDGSTNVCPSVVATSNVKCRDAAIGGCDVDDFCDGTTTACADAKQAPGAVCRIATGDCDVADTCNGTSNLCVDNVAPSTTSCRTSQGVCDVEDFCSGVSKVCIDVKRPLNTVCRNAVAGGCDVQEVCDGASPLCPNDVVEAVGKVCRAANGQCDVPESCNGSNTCPAEGFQPDGSSCTDAADKCLLSTTCTAGQCGGGTAKTCAQNEPCKTNACVPATGNCALSNKLNNTPCDDSIGCTTGDRCQNGSCVGTANNTLCNKPEHGCGTYTCDPSTNPATYPDYCRMTPLDKGEQCRGAKGICGLAEVCDGSSEDCPPDVHKDPSVPCQLPSCVGAVAKPQINCSGNAELCPTQSDVACTEYACDATTKTCGVGCTNDDGCQPDHYCDAGNCEKRVNPGGKCTDNSQCDKSNPHCVDGVCCNTVCTGQCEACDIEGKAGTCSIVTGEPHGDRTACRGDGSACNGTCGGTLRNNCTFPAPQVVCVDAACDPKTSTAVEQAFCDGAGNCAQLDPMDCTPYSCGATACRGNCVSDAQCAKGAFCKAGICEELQEPGVKCSRDGQCASGFCTDGVCCEGRCDGQCEACGKGGKCEATTGAPAGARPACAGTDGDACAGACDGKLRATCVYPAGEVRCRDASCSAGKATVVAHCTGAGSCAPEQTVACTNGCEGAICAGDACLVNRDCKAGEHCIAGTCAPQSKDGAACGSASDCDSGFCVDGVCCDRACDGQCEACDGAKAGVCSPVSGAPHGSRVQCTTDGSACGGACDGKNAEGCSYPTGTACGQGSCTPGQDGAEAVATVEAQCNGSGRCPAPRQQACGGDGCDADEKQCNGDCADGSACATGQFCSAGVCVDTQPSGTACRAASDCASGFCVDGYCCGSACDDRCAACDVPGSLGTCTPVSGNTHGGRAGCQGGGVCGAQCDGKNVTDCAFAKSGTECGAGYCSSGTQVGESACDGAGQCQPGEQIACSSFSCDGAECSDACETDSDCTRSMQCREGQCTEPYKINAVDEGTCGCRTPGGAPDSSRAVWLGLGLAALWSLRRRRAA